MVFTLVPLERGMFALSFHYRQESLSQLSQVCSSGKISHFYCKMPCPSLYEVCLAMNLKLGIWHTAQARCIEQDLLGFHSHSHSFPPYTDPEQLHSEVVNTEMLQMYQEKRESPLWCFVVNFTNFRSYTGLFVSIDPSLEMISLSTLSLEAQDPNDVLTCKVADHFFLIICIQFTHPIYGHWTLCRRMMFLLYCRAETI